MIPARDTAPLNSGRRQMKEIQRRPYQRDNSTPNSGPNPRDRPYARLKKSHHRHRVPQGPESQLPLSSHRPLTLYYGLAYQKDDNYKHKNTHISHHYRYHPLSRISLMTAQLPPRAPLLRTLLTFTLPFILAETKPFPQSSKERKSLLLRKRARTLSVIDALPRGSILQCSVLRGISRAR